jgi:hypothetical protein
MELTHHISTDRHADKASRGTQVGHGTEPGDRGDELPRESQQQVGALSKRKKGNILRESPMIFGKIYGFR